MIPSVELPVGECHTFEVFDTSFLEKKLISLKKEHLTKVVYACGRSGSNPELERSTEVVNTGSDSSTAYPSVARNLPT